MKIGGRECAHDRRAAALTSTIGVDHLLQHQPPLSGTETHGSTDEVLLQLGGVPRTIGTLALRALYVAAGQNKHLVDLEDVIATALWSVVTIDSTPRPIGRAHDRSDRHGCRGHPCLTYYLKRY